MALFDDLAVKKNELIRRAKTGSVFVAAMSVAIPAAWTSGASGDLIALDPEDWTDLGWTNTDGVEFPRETESVDMNSFGSSEPTRSDVTRDEISMNVTAQETKLITIGITTGADTAAIEAAAVTGEVKINKPAKPRLRFYRTLGLFLDHDDNGDEIYFGRFMPRAQVNDFGSQTYSDDETGISYPMTFRGKEDSTAGYAHQWWWGGKGWLALLSDMGIPQAT